MSDKLSPLAGLRVIDMTRVVAGPFCGQILGDLGAEVIKIERKDTGDENRMVGPPWMPTKVRGRLDSTYYQAVNRNKQSIIVDIASAEGSALIRELAAESDIILENFRPGTLAKYGLGYDDLHAVNPGLIYCSVTGFGQTGPYSSRSGYDYLMQGMSGLMSVTGLRDGEPGAGPVRVGVPIADLVSGMNLTIGVLAALQHRNRTGEGQQVDVSLFDSQVSVMLNSASSWLNAEVLLGRTGNDHPSAAPYGVFDVEDGRMIIAIFNDREFERLANTLGHPEWLEDARFSTNGARVGNRAAIKAAVTEALRGRTRAEWVELLNAARVSCGPINEMSDVFQDPHTIAREMVVELPHAIHGAIRMVGSPLKLSASPVTYRIAPPSPGEHTRQILKDVLKRSDEEISELIQSGTIE